MAFKDRPELKLPYIIWNNLLAQHFFQPSKAQQPVYLDVTSQLITEIGKPHGADLNDFVAAVKRGPDWILEGNVCQRAEQSTKRWRRRKLEYPPYVGYLCLFALAAGLEGNFHTNAYYPRLRTLLGETPESGTYPHFHDILAVWDELEEWSEKDKQGDLGLFKVNWAGSHIYVGVPFAQTILSERERQAMPEIFAAAGLDPRALPVDQEILRLLRVHGANLLHGRTRRLLAQPQQDSALTAALVSVVRQLIATWDGTFTAREPSNQQLGSRIDQRLRNGVLRLTLRIDAVSGRAITNLRCSLNQEFPDEGFEFRGANLPDLWATEEAAGWSTPLTNSGTTTAFNACQLNWREGEVLSSGNWRFRLPASELRIFTSGHTEGLPGYIETSRVQLGQSYFIACHRDLCILLQLWGADSCDQGISEVNVRTGLPAEWHLFRTGIIQQSVPIKQKLEALAVSTVPRLSLKGGVRQDRSNRYFKFAPPELELVDGDRSIGVFCDEIQLSPSPGTARYPLPPSLIAGARIEATARRSEEIVDRIRFTLEDSAAWKAYQPQSTNEQSASAAPYGESSACWFISLPARWYVDTSSEIYLLGNTPGQVHLWLSRNHLEGWQPVWAVKKCRRGILLSVAFCGAELTPPRYSSGYLPSLEEIHLWKSLVTHTLARVRLPSCDLVQQLWSQYREYAAYV